MGRKLLAMTLCLAFVLTGCGGAGAEKPASTPEMKSAVEIQQDSAQPKKTAAQSRRNEQMKIKIRVNGKELAAVLEDNAAAEALAEKMPMTLHMENLYGREMCYRYGAGALPTGQLRSDRYEVGDIVYWPPRGSFVILYKQNGEEFERQQIGHIESGVEIFDGAGDAEVSFELVKE